MGKLLIGLGVALVVTGLVVWLLERGGGGLGRLPGDFAWSGRNWRVSFPLASGIVISVALTVLANLALWLSRRR